MCEDTSSVLGAMFPGQVGSQGQPGPAGVSSCNLQTDHFIEYNTSNLMSLNHGVYHVPLSPSSLSHSHSFLHVFTPQFLNI